MQRYRYCFSILCLVACVVSGCGEDATPPPSEQAAEALRQAERAGERLDAAVEAMTRRTREAQQRLERVRADLRAAMTKRVAMLNRDLADLEARLQRLPAAQEEALRRDLTAVRQRATAVEAALKVYAEAEGNAVAQAEAKLDAAYSELRDAERALSDKIENAGA